MMKLTFAGRSKALVYGVLALFTAFVMPVGLLAGSQAAAAESGSLAGFVYAKDMKTRVAGAVVKLRNLGDGKEFASPPANADGMYGLANIPEGRYVLGVTSAQEDFNLDYILYVKAGELGKLSIALSPSGGQEAGEASVKKKGFFNTVAGRVLVITAIGVGLYFIIVPQNEPSPIR